MTLPVLSGCAPGTPFGQQIAVDSDQQKALAEGARQDQGIAEMKFPSSSSETDKQRALSPQYTTLANYYGAVSRKFAGTDTALTALLEQGRIYETGLKNDQLALNTYRQALREYSNNPKAQAAEAALVKGDGYGKQHEAGLSHSQLHR